MTSKTADRADHLRDLARRRGLDVRPEPSRHGWLAQHPRRYELVDRATGHTVASDLTLDEVNEHLWRVDIYG